ncbi:MAG TPA: hypothetical protein VM142_05410 [Acidimicrobiales bacterium]|nr:hypothetical protein [Acidimicrobiales bacterium]
MASPGTKDRSKGSRKERVVTVPRVVVSVLLAFAVASMYVAFTEHDDSPNPRLRPQVIRAISPLPASLQLRQTEIFVELAPQFTGALTVNGTPVPDDQLDVIEGLNRYAFTPGQGKEIEELPPGRACAVVDYTPVTETSAQGGSYRWCFNVS